MRVVITSLEFEYDLPLAPTRLKPENMNPGEVCKLELAYEEDGNEKVTFDWSGLVGEAADIPEYLRCGAIARLATVLDALKEKLQ